MNAAKDLSFSARSPSVWMSSAGSKTKESAGFSSTLLVQFMVLAACYGYIPCYYKYSVG